MSKYKNIVPIAMLWEYFRDVSKLSDNLNEPNLIITVSKVISNKDPAMVEMSG